VARVVDGRRGEIFSEVHVIDARGARLVLAASGNG
jgi:hypothetical protein